MEHRTALPATLQQKGGAAPAGRPRPLIVPSLYAADHAALAEAVDACAAAGACRFHIDLMDGRFVPALGLSLRALEALARRRPDCAFDVHLMVEDPGRLALAAAEAGASSVTVHAEAEGLSPALIERLHAAGVAAGLALNPATPPEAVAGLGAVRLLLVMLVEPGRPGQLLRPALLGKIAALRRGFPEALIVADGGIDRRHARQVAAAGADHLVCGQAVFAGPPAETLPALAAALSG